MDVCAIHISRSPHIRDHSREFIRLQQFQSFRTGGRARDHVPIALERRPYEIRDGWFVFDQEHGSNLIEAAVSVMT